MAPRLSGQTSIFGVVSFVSKSLMGIEGLLKMASLVYEREIGVGETSGHLSTRIRGQDLTYLSTHSTIRGMP